MILIVALIVPDYVTTGFLLWNAVQYYYNYARVTARVQSMAHEKCIDETSRRLIISEVFVDYFC